MSINVTLLFSCEHYLAAAEAYLRGIERRIAAGLDPQVGSVASVFISRWDAAVADRIPPTLANRLGIAIAGGIYKASDILYVKALAAPFTVNTIPEGTLKALADHGEIGPIMPADGGDCEKVLTQFAEAGVNVESLAARLQDEGAKSFVKSWNELLAVIATKSDTLRKAARPGA